MKRRSHLLPLIVLILSALLLSGCGSQTAPPASVPREETPAAPETVPEAAPEAAPEAPAEEVPQYRHEYPENSIRLKVSLEDMEDLCAQSHRLPRLNHITLLDPISDMSAVEQLRAAFPGVSVGYTMSVCGIPVKDTDREADLSRLKSDQVDEALEALSLLPGPLRIKLSGEDMSFEDVGRFQALPYAPVVDYPFTLYDREFSTADDFMDLNKVSVHDKGEAVRAVLPYMTCLKQLEMEDCGVSNEDMASLRDDFPNIKVVWKVHFGVYAARTDEKRILASIKGIWMTAADVEVLKYCTEVKYLDIGHNIIEDISFVQYMPDLEVAIVAINYWKDATPLASCPKLEYLEIFNTACTDLTPLSGLTNLKHLNICWLKKLTDITPLYGLTGLERLWIGCMTSVPQEQLDEIRQVLPKTKINTTTLNPTSDDWRRCERYDLLCEQLGYNLPYYPYSR